jgi:hypothetical protein
MAMGEPVPLTPQDSEQKDRSPVGPLVRSSDSLAKIWPCWGGDVFVRSDRFSPWDHHNALRMDRLISYGSSTMARYVRVGAIGQTSLVSSIHNTVSKANIPGVLAVAAETSKELVTEALPQATVQGAKWVAANPGTAATCGVAGVGLTLVVAPALATTPLLGAVGFGSKGIIAGLFTLSFS